MACVKKHARFLIIKSPEEQYAQQVTPYTLSFIKNQLFLRTKVERLDDLHGDTVVSSEGNLSVSAVQCQCMFWKSMRFPCRHILKFWG